MRWPEPKAPVRMERIAVVAPSDKIRDALMGVGEAGIVQFDAPEQAGRTEPLAVEEQVHAYAAKAVTRDGVVALAGWCPSTAVDRLATRLRSAAAAVVVLPHPPGGDPPTLLGATNRLDQSFTPLVRTYGTVPYRDIDPTVPAGTAYVVMFGMMFGDAGHGLVLLAMALLVRGGRIRRLAGLRRVWPFIAAAGAAATVFGALYGEFFGPTGLLPVLWLAPLDEPMALMATAVAVGAMLLALAYGVGIVNRWREGGLGLALYASTGIAGAAVFLGIAVIVGAVLIGTVPVMIIGGVLATAGLIFAAAGLYGESGGGADGVAQAGIGLFDLLVRMGSSIVSFARLAAFGITHAALGWVVWTATVSLARGGPFAIVGAALVFAVGNVLAFALEALVAGIQALRLEYYELFSRVFLGEGIPFRPWRIATVDHQEST
ncbi:V-type ATPase 116kDa subunit family protein [Nocardia australiensis]|uniref:V-type ATPase 116kDa subunit family protein n=1 Tax=Nocardia australiensis TaxID=2887191 RepID=UPI001D1479B5|nr:V-type ATPase 116kDa subunit family protein [Nocardia australiensis]